MNGPGFIDQEKNHALWASERNRTLDYGKWKKKCVLSFMHKLICPLAEVFLSLRFEQYQSILK